MARATTRAVTIRFRQISLAAAIAVATIEALRAQGWRIDEEPIRTGLREIYWPGRFDVVSKRPLVILDCAHNEMSIAALLETMSVELGPDVVTVYEGQLRGDGLRVAITARQAAAISQQAMTAQVRVRREARPARS